MNSTPVGRRLLALAAVFCLVGCSPPEAEFDVVLRGGTVVDGTGAPSRVADVAIVSNSIVEVGSIPEGSGALEVDVSGLVVAPGFWDNHAHLVELEDRPVPENFIRQGVTTIVASLHSQDQVFPMEPYRDRVRMAPNVGLFAGHTWIRKRVMGLEDRAPTADELRWMVALVDSSMAQGALGLSSGLEYVPSIYSELDEVVALAEAAAPYGGVYATHMRDEGYRVLEAIHETLEVGRRAGVPVQINHHKVTGAAHFGMTERTLAMLDSASAAGTEVVHDVYPYTAYSTYSDLLFPAWSLADGAEAYVRRASDPATRVRLASEMREIFPRQTGEGPQSVQFREVEGRPELQGRTLADYLGDLGQPLTIEASVEALIDLQIEGGFIGIFHGMDEDDVRRILRHPTSMIESDGDLVEFGVGYPHPRSYGSFPRVLAKYVREEGVLSLEEAVRKMTSLPAAWLAQSNRGVLAAGMRADIVVFDAETIQDLSEYTDPHHYSEGITHVLINGEWVLRDSELTGATPGEFLERRRAPSATGTVSR